MKRQALRATRRSFIRAVGAGFAGLPFFKLLEDSHVKAVGGTLPLRFITIYHPHGIAAELWAMKSSDTETVFDIGYANCSLQPFDDAVTFGKSFKDKILVLEGVDHMSNANGHDSAGTILTGSRIDTSARKPLNASLDQVLAVDNKLGADTPVTSIALGVGNDSTESGTTLSYGPGGCQVSLRLRTAPTCQSCGAITPPAAWTSSITRFHADNSFSPWKRGMFGSFSEAGRSTPVPSETIRPTWPSARRR